MGLSPGSDSSMWNFEELDRIEELMRTGDSQAECRVLQYLGVVTESVKTIEGSAEEIDEPPGLEDSASENDVPDRREEDIPPRQRLRRMKPLTAGGGKAKESTAINAYTERPVLTVQKDQEMRRRLRMVKGMTVDSGAADNVIPRRMVRGKNNKIRPSPGSRGGVHYVSASNNRIPNEGECDFHFSTKDGQEQSFIFQIAEVNKALCAVSYLVDNGNQVVFDQDEKTGKDTSRIIHKATGKVIQLVRDRNVWTIDAYVDDEANDQAGFHRQGQLRRRQ